MKPILIAAMLLLPTAAFAADPVKVTPLFGQELAGLPGKEGAMLTVDLGPGASSPAHRHNAHVFVYVLEGSVVMQVTGKEAVTLQPGGTFYESPDDVHTVGKNASATAPAKFMAVFVKDKGTGFVFPDK